MHGGVAGNEELRTRMLSGAGETIPHIEAGRAKIVWEGMGAKGKWMPFER